MDDAFAGGVCRCQHCGTIQTVPSHAKNAAFPQPAGKTSSKSLYKGRTTASLDSATSSSSGLDELASAVASSGLASELSSKPTPRIGTDRTPGTRQGSGSTSSSSRGNGSRGQTLAYQTPPGGAKKNNLVLILAISGGAAVVLIIVLLVVLLGRSSSPTTAFTPSVGGGSSGTSGGNVASLATSGGEAGAASGPRFCDLPLTGQRVVYVLDRGDASKQLFDPLKSAAYKSIETLGPDREFAIIFWKRSTDSGLEDVSFPNKGTVRATTGELDACRKKFEDLTASGATEIDDAINAAMARKPDEIVIATPKGYLLEENVLAAVERARGTSPVKIHTIGLGSGGSSNVLKAIAEKAGGTYREIPEKDLRAQ
jgi:hypothetical protein